MPEDSLRQRELSERFDVSATPIREALQRLALEGYVLLEEHRGATVLGHQGRFHESYLILETLLGLGVRVACDRGTPDGVESLRRIRSQYAQGIADGMSQNGLYHVSQSFSDELLRLGSLPMTSHMMRTARAAHSDYHTELIPERSDLLNSHRLEWMDEVTAAIEAKDAHRGREATRRFGERLFMTFGPMANNRASN